MERAVYAKIHFLGSVLRRLRHGSVVYKRYLVETPLGTKAYDSLEGALRAAKSVLPSRPERPLPTPPEGARDLPRSERDPESRP